MRDLIKTISEEVYECPVCGMIFVKADIQEFRNHSIQKKEWKHCPVCGEELNMEVLYNE